MEKISKTLKNKILDNINHYNNRLQELISTESNSDRPDTTTITQLKIRQDMVIEIYIKIEKTLRNARPIRPYKERKQNERRNPLLTKRNPKFQESNNYSNTQTREEK